MQEAWLRLARYGTATAVEKPEAFLMHAALNLSIDAYRSHVRHGPHLLVEDVILLADAPDQESTLLARERLARLNQGIGRLSPKTRNVLLAHRLNDMSYMQIASVYGLSVSAVEKHIARATLQLTSWMEGW